MSQKLIKYSSSSGASSHPDQETVSVSSKDPLQQPIQVGEQQLLPAIESVKNQHWQTKRRNKGQVQLVKLKGTHRGGETR